MLPLVQDTPQRESHYLLHHPEDAGPPACLCAPMFDVRQRGALQEERRTLGVCVVARHHRHPHHRDQTGARCSGVIAHTLPQTARGFLGLPREAHAHQHLPADDEAHGTEQEWPSSRAIASGGREADLRPQSTVIAHEWPPKWAAGWRIRAIGWREPGLRAPVSRLAGQPPQPPAAHRAPAPRSASSRVPSGWSAAAAASSAPRTCASCHIGTLLLAALARLARAQIASSRVSSGWPAAAAASSAPRVCASCHIGTWLLTASARLAKARTARIRVPSGWPAAAAASNTPRTCASSHIGTQWLAAMARLLRARIACSRVQTDWPAAAAASSTPRVCASSHIGTWVLSATVRLARARTACPRIVSGWPAAAAASSTPRVCASSHIGSWLLAASASLTRATSADIRVSSGWSVAAAASSAARVCASSHIVTLIKPRARLRAAGAATERPGRRVGRRSGRNTTNGRTNEHLDYDVNLLQRLTSEEQEAPPKRLRGGPSTTSPDVGNLIYIRSKQRVRNIHHTGPGQLHDQRALAPHCIGRLAEAGGCYSRGGGPRDVHEHGDGGDETDGQEHPGRQAGRLGSARRDVSQAVEQAAQIDVGRHIGQAADRRRRCVDVQRHGGEAEEVRVERRGQQGRQAEADDDLEWLLLERAHHTLDDLAVPQPAACPEHQRRLGEQEGRDAADRVGQPREGQPWPEAV
eukprot:scaffold18342_cov63-Phaeocystis_antarctica.AAC.3